MAVLLEDIVRAVELWLKPIEKPEPYVDPNLDPVLLVPGIAGSMLNAVDMNGKEERVWVRSLGSDHEFRTKLWSLFNPSTGKTESLDCNTRIKVPEDRYGLYAVDLLDPDMILARDSVSYFHEMIVEMISWGYLEGKTLFGFGYDFRQSNRFQETLNRLTEKLESVCMASSGKKINVITHSMGGLLVKCFISLHSDIFEKYVKSWIAIATPFRGAPGFSTMSLLNGVTFVDSITKWNMHQLLIECPSVYELMACPDFKWENPPRLNLWKKNRDSKIILESYSSVESISIFEEALSINMVNYEGVDIPLPFNFEILKWANETRKILDNAKIPPQVKFYNVYGVNHETPHTVCYGSEDSPVTDIKQLPCCAAEYICVDGDGTVPAESAMADGLNAEARVGIPGGHKRMLSQDNLFRIIKHWLKADHDPFDNRVNDYVILPTSFEIERHQEEKGGLQVTSLKEEWEIITDDDVEGSIKPLGL